MLSLKFDINVLPKLWKYQNSPVNENRRSHSKGNPLIPKRSDLNKTTFATGGVKRSKLSLKFPYENSAIGSEYKALWVTHESRLLNLFFASWLM